MALWKRDQNTSEPKLVQEQQDSFSNNISANEYVRWTDLSDILQEIAKCYRETHAQQNITSQESSFQEERSTDLFIKNSNLSSSEDAWFDIKQTLIKLNTLIRDQSDKCNCIDPDIIVQMSSLIERFEDVRTRQLADRLIRVHKSLLKTQEKLSLINYSFDATMNTDEQLYVDGLCKNLQRAQNDTKAALRELEQFGIYVIAPEIGDLFDESRMDSLTSIPGYGIDTVKQVIEYGYAQSRIQTDTPTVIKKALVQLC